MSKLRINTISIWVERVKKRNTKQTNQMDQTTGNWPYTISPSHTANRKKLRKFMRFIKMLFFIIVYTVYTYTLRRNAKSEVFDFY